MAVGGDDAAAERTGGRDRSLGNGAIVGFLGVIVTVVAVGVAMLGAVDRIRDEIQGIRGELQGIRAEIQELRRGQVEIRERLTRVETKIGVLAGDWPPPRSGKPSGEDAP